MKILSISQDRYDQQSKKLLRLGFSDKQTQKMVIKISSSNTVKTLIAYYNKACEYLSHSDLIGVCSKYCGGKTLLKIIRCRKRLNTIGFTDQNIVAITSNDGGSKTLQAVIDNQNYISTSDMTKEKLTSKLSVNSGSKVLENLML